MTTNEFKEILEKRPALRWFQSITMDLLLNKLKVLIIKRNTKFVCIFIFAILYKLFFELSRPRYSIIDLIFLGYDCYILYI